MDSILESDAMQKLVKLVEEAARSTKEGVRYFVEPAQGTLSRATSKRHHMVFGRRGSGKSSLLRKAQAELTVDRIPISYVDLEAYKGHAYPDVLLSILISTLEGFRDWLKGAAVSPANKTSFWTRLFGRSPEKPAYNRKQCQAIRDRIDRMLEELRQQLHSADDAAMELSSAQEQSGTISSGASARVALGGGKQEPTLQQTPMNGFPENQERRSGDPRWIFSIGTSSTIKTFSSRWPTCLHLTRTFS